MIAAMPEAVAMHSSAPSSEPLLEHSHGRIREARVDVTFLGAREARGRLCRALEDEARGQKERFAVLVEGSAHRPGADGTGIEIEVGSSDVIGHKKTRRRQRSGFI
jgi:hypothetical protein